MEKEEEKEERFLIDEKEKMMIRKFCVKMMSIPGLNSL